MLGQERELVGVGRGRGERESRCSRKASWKKGQLRTKLTCSGKERRKGKPRKREGQMSSMWSYMVCRQTKASLGR